MDVNQFAYFLGGHDLEMVTIRDLLKQHTSADRLHDKNLAWGADVDAYARELSSARQRGQTPVLIELAGAEEWSNTLGCPCVVVDHHGARAGSDRPSSLRQVFELVGRPSAEWSRWFELVDANDKGHVKAMQAVRATIEEMREVRTRDRAAQGVTPDEEAQGQDAARRATVRLGGKLTVAEIPHDRTSPVADALSEELGGPGFQNLLIIANPGRHFFGRGKAVEKLHQQFGGWKGGMLPERGFWGIGQPLAAAAILEFLIKEERLLE